jgi:hypothetical protein
VIVASASAPSEGPIRWERLRAASGIGLTVAAALGVVIFLLDAIRVGSAVHVVPTDIIHRWRRDFAVLTGVAAVLLGGGVALWLPLARRRSRAFRPWVVALGVLTLPLWFSLLVAVGSLALLGLGEGPHTVPARPVSTASTIPGPPTSSGVGR